MRTISLLHATYHRTGGVAEIIDAWLDRACHPLSIEYIVAADDDDEIDLGRHAGSVRLLRGPKDENWSTAVRNWNLAASVATGDLLLVVSDDLFPCDAWDLQLRTLCGALDPNSVHFAIKLGDSEWPRDPRLRHPLVSRAFYRDLGLFDPRFHGVYCDDDITLRALWRAVIIDGRRVKFDHHNPLITGRAGSSESQIRANRDVEYEHGSEVFRSIWPAHRRRVRVLFARSEGRRWSALLRHWLIRNPRTLGAMSSAWYWATIAPITLLKSMRRSRRGPRQRAVVRD